MKLVDVHCHLESAELRGSLDQILSEAKHAGIVKLITSSVSPDQWETSRSIAAAYNEVEYSAGIHPWYASFSELEKIDGLKSIKEDGAIAIGEIGLDRKIDNPGIELQTQIFERQLEIAKEINLPLIIHCRGAYNELIQILKKTGAPAAGGIVHSYSSSAEIAVELTAYGFSFSMGGVLTYKLSKKRKEVLNKIYPDHFMLETDSPDIVPVGIDEIPNLPKNIIYNLRAASKILGVSEEKIAEATTRNAAEMFGLSV